MLNRGVPSEEALLAFDRAVDALIRSHSKGDVSADSSPPNWDPLLDVAKILHAEGARSRTRDAGTMARIWEDVRRHREQQSVAPSRANWRRIVHPARPSARLGQSLLAGSFLGIFTVTVSRLSGVPLSILGAPSVALTLTTIGYQVSERRVAF